MNAVDMKSDFELDRAARLCAATSISSVSCCTYIDVFVWRLR